ncbi:hypothetical protein K443DRAFT_8425 [Laccaria amethystina LaAM-08-1]|uniref:Uncharacterized protein n=1 Tax=Laccaria amethystina LaAM-08-1 TaxID=1095629 RepID=A0A0C9X2Q4_9AGAR|nr:hypothetical protein K443DRAFT_8425 [Laccaria amethystina LaAM-08-1]
MSKATPSHPSRMAVWIRGIIIRPSLPDIDIQKCLYYLTPGKRFPFARAAEKKIPNFVFGVTNPNGELYFCGSDTRVFDDPASEKIAALKLVQQGNVSLDTPISTYIAELKELGIISSSEPLTLKPADATITLMQILSGTTQAVYTTNGELNDVLNNFYNKIKVPFRLAKGAGGSPGSSQSPIVCADKSLNPSLGLQVLHLIRIYNGMSGKECNLEQSYAFLDLAGQVALRMDFHVDPTLWGFKGREAYDRRVYFRNLMSPVLWPVQPGDWTFPKSSDILRRLQDPNRGPLSTGRSSPWVRDMGFQNSRLCLVRTVLPAKPPSDDVTADALGGGGGHLGWPFFPWWASKGSETRRYANTFNTPPPPQQQRQYQPPQQRYSMSRLHEQPYQLPFLSIDNINHQRNNDSNGQYQTIAQLSGGWVGLFHEVPGPSYGLPTQGGGVYWRPKSRAADWRWSDVG